MKYNNQPPQRPPNPQEQIRNAAEHARNVEITAQRERAKDLLTKAVTKEQIDTAVHQAGVEIAEAELKKSDATAYADPLSMAERRSNDEIAHSANVDVILAEINGKEKLRLVELRTKQDQDNARRASEVDFVANEMKLSKAIRHLSSGG
jgi:hypothetical protein